MGSVRGLRKPGIFAIAGALLMILSIFTLKQEIPILGYDMTVVDPSDSWNGERRAIVDGPFTPEALEPRTGVVIDNLTIHVQRGNVTSLDFRLGLQSGFAPANITNARIHFVGGYLSAYYPLFNFSDRESSMNASLWVDPAGQMARGFLDRNSILAFTIKGHIGSAEDRITLYFEPSRGRMEEFRFHPPRFINESPLGSERPYHVNVDDMDGSYPRFPDGAWTIANRTVLENQTVYLDRDLLIVDNGSLELRNSTLIVNSSVENHRLFKMDSSFEAHLQNTTIDAEIRMELQRNDLSISSGALERLTDTVWRIGGSYANPTYYIERTEEGLYVYSIKFNEYWGSYFIYIGYDAKLLVSNSTIRSDDNRTVPISYAGSGYKLEVLGEIAIEGSNISASDRTYSEIEIYSENARISNSTVGITVSCSFCSPAINDNLFAGDHWSFIGLFRSGARIQNNVFNGSVSAVQGSDRTNGIGIRATQSDPVIFGNTFRNLDEATMFGWCYDHPQIKNNSFDNSALAVELDTTNADIEDNSITNTITGIRLSGASAANIKGNSISAREPIKVMMLSNATVSDNSLSEYEKYGIYGLDSVLAFRDNTFRPLANCTKTSYAVYGEKSLSFSITLERQGRREPVKADMTLLSGNRPQNLPVPRSAGSCEYWYTKVPVSIMTNTGKRHDLNPYKLVVSYSIWQTSSDIEIDPDSGYHPTVEINIKDKSMDYPLKIAIGLIGIVLLTFASDRMLRHFRQKKQTPQAPRESPLLVRDIE